MTKAFGVAVALLVSACGSQVKHSVTYSVDGVEFSVPTDYLIPNEIPWLPIKQATGFNFTLDPGLGPEEHILVNVEPKSVVCRLDKVSVAPQLRDVCAGSQPSSPPTNFSAETERVYPDEHHDHWMYAVKNGSSNSAMTPYATCSETGVQAKRKQCYSMGLYQHIIYSILYPDSEVGRLGSIRHSVEIFLSKWQVKE